MGKNEFMTPKAIANRIKAKGLQKLRWYCQMCEKQCRDQNGFKCHCMSDSHQRQMQLFGQNPGRFIHTFSNDFENAFMEHMRRSHRSSRVAATVVYNEYIADRNHVHMNSSRWSTLTGFVQYLGKCGKCKVEDTPKGFFLTYIDREPETLLKAHMKNKRKKADLADEERHERMIAHQIERAQKAQCRPDGEFDDDKEPGTGDPGSGMEPDMDGVETDESDGEFVGEFDDSMEEEEEGEDDGLPFGLETGGTSKVAAEEEPKDWNESHGNEKKVTGGEEAEEFHDVAKSRMDIEAGRGAKAAEGEPEGVGSEKSERGNMTAFSLGSKSVEKSKPVVVKPAVIFAKPSLPAAAGISPKAVAGFKPKKQQEEFRKKEAKKGSSSLEELMREQEQAKERLNRKDYWLCEELVVKVMSKALSGYYKQKGVVKKVIGKYVGEISMIDSGDVLKVDQEELETVIPQIGGIVRIVNGAYRDSNARLVSIDTANFCAKVQIEKGPYDGRTVPSIAYEDICKMSS